MIDCDVHQELGDDDAAIYPYLGAGWQEFVQGPAGSTINGVRTSGNAIPAEAPVKPYGSNPFGALRKDAVPPSGLTAGSDPRFMAEQFLDRYDVGAAILTGGGTAMGISAWANPYYARELARAYNDQTVEEWLAADPRYHASVMPAIQVPEWGAEEIRRLAGHPRVVQAMLLSNPHGAAFGHPLYDPIHRACADTGLPLAIHAFGDGLGAAVPSPTASAYPSLYAEFHSSASQGLMTHLMSFILHGVFDRYRDFKLVIVEGGSTWLPAFVRRLEADFKGLRREVPWVRKLPSEYLVEHVRVTTQPFDVEDADDPLLGALDALGAEDVLVYASDYPHWDTDVPTRIGAVLPDRWRDKVLHENAAKLYGIRLPVAA